MVDNFLLIMIQKKCRVTFQQLNFADQVIRDTVVPMYLVLVSSWNLQLALHQTRRDLEKWVIMFRRRGLGMGQRFQKFVFI